MNLIDQVLNWTGVLFWLNWRSIGFSKAPQVGGPSLLSTLKRAETPPAARWINLTSLFGLLGLRSFFYWHIGSEVNWTPTLDLCAITLPFRSDQPQLMVLFSLASFGLALGAFYSWLLLISIANRSVRDLDPLQRLVRLHLGWLESWPDVLKLLLPMTATTLLWGLFSPHLGSLGLLPIPVSKLQLWEQAFLLGTATLLVWKYFLLCVLALHLVNSHVYLGRAALFAFVSLTARNLLRPLDWIPLRMGRIDFAPALGIGLVLLAAEFAARWFAKFYPRLPL